MKKKTWVKDGIILIIALSLTGCMSQAPRTEKKGSPSPGRMERLGDGLVRYTYETCILEVPERFIFRSGDLPLGGKAVFSSDTEETLTVEMWQLSLSEVTVEGLKKQIDRFPPDPLEIIYRRPVQINGWTGYTLADQRGAGKQTTVVRHAVLTREPLGQHDLIFTLHYETRAIDTKAEETFQRILTGFLPPAEESVPLGG